MLHDLLIICYIGGALVTTVDLFCVLWERAFDRLRPTVWTCATQFVTLFSLSLIAGCVWPLYNLARLMRWWRQPVAARYTAAHTRTHVDRRLTVNVVGEHLPEQTTTTNQGDQT